MTYRLEQRGPCTDRWAPVLRTDDTVTGYTTRDAADTARTVLEESTGREVRVTTDLTSAAHTVWQRQFNQLADALLPWRRVTADEGFAYIDPHAPAELVERYRSACATGFAHGWML